MENMTAKTIKDHTPGPWDYVPSCEHHGAYVTDDFGATICDFYTMSDPSRASIRNGGTSRPMPFSNADANALLTAAGLITIPIIPRRVIDAAIAKATGEVS